MPKDGLGKATPKPEDELKKKELCQKCEVLQDRRYRPWMKADAVLAEAASTQIFTRG
jgi:hypothetical protein